MNAPQSTTNILDESVNQAATIDKQIKALQKQLRPISEQLANHLGEGGKHITPQGNSVAISKAPETASVADVMSALTMISESDVNKLVKINATAFKKKFPGNPLVAIKFGKSRVTYK